MSQNESTLTWFWLGALVVSLWLWTVLLTFELEDFTDTGVGCTDECLDRR